MGTSGILLSSVVLAACVCSINAIVFFSLTDCEEVCRKRLKTLTDKMRTITNNLPKTKSGQPAFQKGQDVVRWPFYQAMLFMKDQFVGREMSGTFHVSTMEENQQEGSVGSPVDIDDETTTESQSLLRPDIPMPQKQARSTPRMSKKARVAEEFLDIEREKMASLKKALASEEPKDEWAAFCSSITCDLRKLRDPYLIMRVKGDISKTVNDAVLQQFQQDAQTAVDVSGTCTSYSNMRYTSNYHV